jgi:hypothetical protein
VGCLIVREQNPLQTFSYKKKKEKKKGGRELLGFEHK